MRGKIHNPFAYSNTVTGESFCNRKKELSHLLRNIEGSQNILLYSHRRYGKSSLIRQCFQQIRGTKSRIGAMHVELYGTTSERDFITRTFHALNQLESNFDRLIKSVNKALKNITLQLRVDPATGSTSVSPTFEAVREETVLEELMDILRKYSQRRRLAIAFDEFQEVANYTEEGFEKRLRSFIQQHSRICYIFSGSRQHLLADMFHSNKRAFYKMAESLPLQKIETKHYIPWIQDLFKGRNVDLSRGFIEEVVARFENHPMYIQNFLFHLWEEPLTEGVSVETIDRIEKDLIEKRYLEHTVLWETLTINQRKTLKLILLQNGANLYNADALKSVNIKTASSVTKALASLLQKEIIVKNGVYMIQDITLKRWLQKTLFL